jgi:hypothetical protein
MHANSGKTMGHKRACVSDDAYITGYSVLGSPVP